MKRLLLLYGHKLNGKGSITCGFRSVCKRLNRGKETRSISFPFSQPVNWTDKNLFPRCERDTLGY